MSRNFIDDVAPHCGNECKQWSRGEFRGMPESIKGSVQHGIQCAIFWHEHGML